MENKEISQFEARAYKELYTLYRGTLHTILHKVSIAIEYQKEKPEELLALLESFHNKHKWQYHGIQDDRITAIITGLEKCLGER